MAAARAPAITQCRCVGGCFKQVRPVLGVKTVNHRHRLIMARAESTNGTGTEPKQEITSSSDGDYLSSDELAKLSAVRRQQQDQKTTAQSTNIIQGALEEAQLITWPKPQKAFLDTILVLAIVALSGTLLLGMNVLLASASEW
eukprot:CAMPEP_0202896804 /NCGR_PEP_ID=MMETSP1392-20130828/5729_1 /ASSEMBLY_ACC=CAM_ASM_000868 /TAXON_ID=225041 /ORGANISM="Chlamydomonas chlamydogama, Strain SAG 11-48b" /LENGTH=142 /DNA_ID=CAMNT_0049582281 /DNA_START=29 /DNA_END=454 /DNA_ORIENTATION=-